MSQPLVRVGEVPIFSTKTFANIEQIATYIQLTINGMIPDNDYRIGYVNSQLALLRNGEFDSFVNLSGITLTDNQLRGPAGIRGPAGPTGNVEASIQIALIAVVVVAIIGVMIAFGRYLEHLDQQSG